MRVIQNEKKKKEKQHEISSDNNILIKSSEPQIQTQQQYEFIIEFCRVVYRLNELSIYLMVGQPWYIASYSHK